MVGGYIKEYIESTADPAEGFKPLPHMTARKIKIYSVQYGNDDGTSDLEIEEAKGKIWGSSETHTNAMEDRIVGDDATLTITSLASKNVQWLNVPITLTGPLYYKDNGGPGNKVLIKYKQIP